MKNIDDIGNRLGRSQNLKDLTKYKSLVKQFVKEAVELGMKVKKRQLVGSVWPRERLACCTGN